MLRVWVGKVTSLSVSSNDVTSYFVVEKAEPLDALFEKINTSFNNTQRSQQMRKIEG